MAEGNLEGVPPQRKPLKLPPPGKPEEGKRRKKSANIEEAAKVPVWDIPVSMIDIVFQLLIYFMLTANFIPADRRMDIDLPTDQGPEQAASKEKLDEETIMVYLKYRSDKDTSKIYTWRGLKVEVNQEHQGYDKEGLKKLYETLRNLAATGKEKPVQLFATKNCPFLNVVSAIDSCKRVELKKLRFTLPLRKEGGGSDFWHLE